MTEESTPESLWHAFLTWLLPPRSIVTSELRGIERIAEARRQEEREVWADPRVQRRIIEGRGLKSGKLYGYMAQGREQVAVGQSHVVRGSFTREVGR